MEIAAAAHAKALIDIDDILTDDDSVDYLPPRQQPIEPQIQVQAPTLPLSDSNNPNISTP